LSNDKEVSCCCWKSGSISGDIRLQRRCYVPGETIFINMQIVNNSQSEVHSIRASLKQVFCMLVVIVVSGIAGVGSEVILLKLCIGFLRTS